MPNPVEPSCVGALCWSACRRGFPQGKGKGNRNARPLIPKQLRVLQEYQSGELRTRAKKLTMTSGQCRLKADEGSFVDIGGSIGGFVRTVLDDWEPPDLAYFEA